MAVVLLAAALGAAVGRLRRHHDRGAGGTDARLHHVRWLVVALTAQVLAVVLLPASRGWQVGALLGSLLLAAVVVGRNARVPGMPLVGAGLVLNAAVIVANGGMPVSPPAAARAGIPTEALQLAGDPRHVELSGATRLPYLADVLPVPLPVHPEVVSVGDVLVAAGAFLLAAALARRRKERDPCGTPVRTGPSAR